MSTSSQEETSAPDEAALKEKNQRLGECVSNVQEEHTQAQVEAAARRESDELHRLIFENIRDFSIFFADLEGRIVRWNPGAERFFGYTAAEILGQPMDVLYTPEDRAKGIAEMERRRAAKTGRSNDERWHLRKDGTRFFVYGIVNALRDDAGELRGFVKIARDVTEGKKYQERLRRSEELHRLIIENIHDFAIFTCDFDGHVETWNPGAERIFGYAEAEIKGKNLAMLYLPEDRSNGVPEKDRADALRNDSTGKDRWYVRKDGRPIFLTGAVRPIEDQAGNLRGFAKVARDITVRKKLEEQLSEAHENLEKVVSERTEKLQETVAELKAFSYSLSHDMRAPVRAIQSFCELAKAEMSDKAAPLAMEYLEKACRSAQRLDQLIQDVLALSHLSQQELTFEAVDLDKLVREIIQERPEFQDPKARITIQGPLQPVIGNEALLTQCITNLLSNAVKFVAPSVKPHIRIWTERDGDKVRIWVEDNGIGMDPQAQLHIFRMFSRVHPGDKYPGTGIGLAIVRKAVEAMGGEIGVESKPGDGSRFWLRLASAER